MERRIASALRREKRELDLALNRELTPVTFFKRNDLKVRQIGIGFAAIDLGARFWRKDCGS